ncbi:ABC transporter ATP-binding protein [Atopobacter phocae]|uniref:ATP-binding cassette domain-containing protein n=1 Tax=Atopobacter phocae TaxID=136492 RepID=UPI00046F2E5D|nr:ABC transporter ATP-binding protein [Atopobacter phocae]
MKLVIEQLKKDFKDKQVLKGASFEFESGKIYGLLGKNGAGKTTLFNIIYGELEKNDGRFYLEENGETLEINYEHVGMLFSENFLPDFLTGYEFVKFFNDLNGDGQTPDHYLDLMDFSREDRHLLIKDYSHGMKSKLSLLSIIIGKQKIILLDEPLTSIDVVMAAEIKKILKALKKDHILILSTHILELANDLCDEIVILHDGQLMPFEHLQNDEHFERKIVELLKESKKND